MRAQLNTLVRDAATVRHFQPTTVPSMLQTPEYARWAIELADLGGQHDHDGVLAAQLGLQRILFEPDCPRYHFLLGEVGLRYRPDDTEQPHRAQLDRILSVAALPSVTIQVLRANARFAPLGRHGFRLFEFADAVDEPPVAYLDLICDDMIVHEPENVGVFVSTWEHLLACALSPDDSLEFIRGLP
jgi:hypothetical protein